MLYFGVSFAASVSCYTMHIASRRKTLSLLHSESLSSSPGVSVTAAAVEFHVRAGSCLLPTTTNTTYITVVSFSFASPAFEKFVRTVYILFVLLLFYPVLNGGLLRVRVHSTLLHYNHHSVLLYAKTTFRGGTNLENGKKERREPLVPFPTSNVYEHT